MKKQYIPPSAFIYSISPLQMIADSLSDTDIPVGGDGTEEFDSKGSTIWDDDDDDGLPPVHFGL